MNWEQKTLGELLEALIDHRGRTPKKLGTDFVANGVPVLSAQLVTNGFIDWSNTRFVDQQTFELWMPQKLKKSDVLLTSEAPLGRTAILNREQNVVLGQRLFALRGKKGVLDNHYLHYWLRSDKGQAVLTSHAQGTTVIGIRQSSLRSISVDLPSITTQKAIADVLGTLDDKIAANQRIADSITDLQSAIWNRAIQDVERVPVGSVALPQLGGTPARKVQENWTNEIPWSSVADMTAANGKYLLNTAEGISIECAKTRRFAPLPAGAVLLSARGTVGKVVTLVSPTSFNQSAYGFAEPENRSAALRLAIEGIVEELRSKSYGSVFSTITKGTILECTVPNVFHEEYSDLHSHLGMLEDRAISAVQENQVLAATRDELLPLLMNGKITVDEAEKAVGDVGVVKQKQ